MSDKPNVSVTTAFFVLTHDQSGCHAMMLRVQLESDLCRVEQIFIPDTQTSLCCSVLQHSGASARPKKHTSYNIASSTPCVFCPRVMQNWLGSADASQALKIETLLEHVALLFAAAQISQAPSPLKYIGVIFAITPPQALRHRAQLSIRTRACGVGRTVSS